MKRAYLSCLFLLLTVLQETCQGQLFVPDLPTGSVYHLVLVTDSERDATSANIVDYDEFVATEINKIPDLATASWLAIASTPDVNAIDRLRIGGPVYRLDGVLVAIDSDDFWDGELLAPVAVSSSMQPAHRFDTVFTGTTIHGLAGECALGSVGCHPDHPGMQLALSGDAGDQHGDWIQERSADFSDSLGHFYALSAPLVVPEASSSFQCHVGAMLLLGFKRRTA